jgi:hypothetical protein
MMTDEQKSYLKSSIQMRSKDTASTRRSSAKYDFSSALESLDSMHLPVLSPQKRFVSSDIVRSRRFDSTAKLMNPSEMRHQSEVPTVHGNIDRNEYCPPCDRIARFVTASAAGLTMKKAQKIAKSIATSHKTSPKVIGFALAATAPDAFGASLKISEIAEVGRLPDKRKLQMPKIELPSANSKLAKREEHRLIRSKPAYNTLKITPHPAEGERENMARNYDDWDPESMDAVVEQKADPRSDAALLKEKTKTLERFNAAVDKIVRSGVLTSAGSGHRAPVVTMDPACIDSIIARVPSLLGFLEEPLMQSLLHRELSVVAMEFCRAVARSSVEYDIKDPVESLAVGVDANVLFNDSSQDLWMNREYLIKEWRVMRMTGMYLN